MKIMRKIIEIDEALCNGCGQCVPACEEGAIEIIDGKARLVAEKYCDGLGACLGECPQGALKIVEREADDFDEEAVEEYLRQKNIAKKIDKKAQATGGGDNPLPCGCPSAISQAFKGSLLGHWPIQLRLVPPHAPFLRDADLLIASDCSVAAYPPFHQEMLPNRALLMGCPKFDDVDIYKERLVDIFKQNNIRSITVVIMEVPCCGAMPRLVEAALKEANVSIPVNRVVIGIKGQKIS